MHICTYFCDKLHAVSLHNGVLPSYDDLVTHFEHNNPVGELKWHLGTWQEIQSRKSCSVCQIVVAAIEEDTQNEVHGRVVSMDQVIDVVLFPEESGFRLTFPSRLGMHMTFIAKGEGQASSPINGRQLGSPVFDLAMVQNWIQSCDQSHSDCGKHVRSQEQTNYTEDSSPYENPEEAQRLEFRVLDLEEACVKRLDLSSRYITLSYVWGQTPTVLLQHDNRELLTSPGGLNKIREYLPRTINDAIDFVRKLGERYLWIDALCLLQDDMSDVELGVSMMHSIFRGSYLTIVAAAGSDGNSGLPGLRKAGSSSLQIIKTLRSGLQITIVRGIDWHLARSVYNQRGWTLQELVLPPRSIIFIEDRMYFRCMQANWCQETWADKWLEWLDSDDSNISRIPRSNEVRMASFWAYQKLCEDYSLRTLRNDGDALRAMGGITRFLFAGMDSPGVEGLPGYYLDMFLLFYSSNANLRRRTQFPSSSWAGWEGRIMWPRENYIRYDDDGEKQRWDPIHVLKWFGEFRLVEWKVLATDGSILSLSSFDTKKAVPILNYEKEFPGVVWGKPQVQSSAYRRVDEPTSSEITRNILNFGNQDWKNLVNTLEAADSEEYERIIRNVEDKRMQFTLRNYLASRRFRARKARLQPWRLRMHRNLPEAYDDLKSAHYRFRPPRLSPDSKDEMDRVKNDKRSNKRAGKRQDHPDIGGSELRTPIFPPYATLQFATISLHFALGEFPSYRSYVDTQKNTIPSMFDRVPAIPLRSKTGSIAGWLHPDNIDIMSEPGSIIELIVLSRCQTPTIKSASEEPVFAQDIPDTPATGPWKLLWVLHVVWIDGIAERRGVGQILEQSLHVAVEPLPALKLIHLG